MKACPACNSRYEDDVTFCSKDGTQVVVDKAAVTVRGGEKIGQVIGERYRLMKKLGEGGMGEVYEAEHIHIEKRVALKLLRAEVLSNQEAVTRFKQEARSASSIGHENIIEIDDFGTLPDGRVYLTMEYLEGAPLSDLIEDESAPLALDRALSIAVQTCHGLAAAHAKGIVHRDMKPENIYVTHQGGRDVPKILDFGIAKVSGGDGNQHLTRTGTIFGTPFYMAPEQALGQVIDHRADVYAMGVILYEVMTGVVPFKGESFMGILTQHITVQPKPPSQQAAEHGRHVPPPVEAVILRAMAKDPSHRFQSMNELAGALTDVYRQAAGAGMTSAYAAPPMNPSQFVPVPMTSHVPLQSGGNVVPSGAMGAMGAAPSGALGAMPSGPHGMPSGVTPVPMGYTPASGLHPVPMGYTPQPSASYAAAAPAKGKGALVAVLAVCGLALGAGGVTWYFLAGPGKSEASTAVVTTVDAGAPVIAVTPPLATVDAAPPTIVVQPLPEDDKAKAVVVLVDTVPRGALIKLDGKKLGETPSNVTITAGRETRLVLERRGYRDEELVIDGTELKVTKKLEEIKKGHGTGGTGTGGSGTGIKPPPDDGHKPPPDDGHKPPPDDGHKPPPDDGDDSDILE